MGSQAVRTALAGFCVMILCTASAYGQVLDIGTEVDYEGPYPDGIENTVTGTVTIEGINGVGGGAISSGVGGFGDNAVIIDSTGASIGSPFSGLFVDSVANTVELSVGSGMTSEGLFISESQTVLSGGSGNPTIMTLDDFGVTFEDDFGSPVQLHGVADGTAPFDAVNRRQLDRAVGNLSSGIAAVAALAAIPGPVDCKNYSVGIGWGHFNDENAGAIGVRGNMIKSNISWALGVGFAESSSPAYDAGIAFSF